MDVLTGNLQTHELNWANDATKKEKSLTLKVTQGEEYEEYEDQIYYITNKFQKIVWNHGCFKKKGNPSRAASANDQWHECGNTRQFIKDCPMQKMEYKDFVKSRSKKYK